MGASSAFDCPALRDRVPEGVKKSILTGLAHTFPPPAGAFLGVSYTFADIMVCASRFFSCLQFEPPVLRSKASLAYMW